MLSIQYEIAWCWISKTILCGNVLLDIIVAAGQTLI